MKKIEFTKLNRSNNDVWGLLKTAIKSRNLALIESTLSRLYSLQKYYINLLNYQDIEINQLKDLLAQETAIRNSFEKEWLESIVKDSPNYEQLKKRINETYKEL